jgi:uncharacterized protein YcfJ
MRSVKLVVVSVVMLVGSSSVAFANSGREVAPVVPLPKASLLADSVVVTPQNQPPPAPQQIQVAPAPATVPVAAPVVVEPSRRTTVVHEDSPHNYMTTIAVSAIMGAVAGALVGGAIYYLGNQEHAARIGYWAGGGVLVGTAVGLTQVIVQENRADVAVASRFSTDPAPTYRLALMNLHF